MGYFIYRFYSEKNNATGDEPAYTFSENNKVTYGSLWMCSGTYTVSENTINIKFTSAVDPDGKEAKVQDLGVNNNVKIMIITENELKDATSGVTYSNTKVNINENTEDNSSVLGYSPVGYWTNDDEGIENWIHEDKSFKKDHFTSSSEVSGKYTISGTEIKFQNNDGEKWSAKLVETSAGSGIMLEVKENGKNIRLWQVQGE